MVTPKLELICILDIEVAFSEEACTLTSQEREFSCAPGVGSMLVSSPHVVVSMLTSEEGCMLSGGEGRHILLVEVCMVVSSPSVDISVLFSSALEEVSICVLGVEGRVDTSSGEVRMLVSSPSVDISMLFSSALEEVSICVLGVEGRVDTSSGEVRMLVSSPSVDISMLFSSALEEVSICVLGVEGMVDTSSGRSACWFLVPLWTFSC